MTTLMIGIEGPGLSKNDLHNINHPLVCGIILFKRNFTNYRQLSDLSNQIKTLKGQNFLLAVDQEGGRVIRFGSPFTQLAALQDIGQLYASNQNQAKTYAHLHAWLMASELLSINIDLSFAPVLDLDNGSDVIGDRAFSSQAEVVIELATIYCHSMQLAGMKTTGKHYPGHGTVKADSHIALPIDDRSFAEINNIDYLPFKNLCQNNCLDAMMLSHVIYQKVCSQPAGYSKIWHNDKLRNKLKFKGISISDDLGMKAAMCVGSIKQRYNACMDADIDLALVCEPAMVDELLPLLSNRPSEHLTQRLSRLTGQSTLKTNTPFWKQKKWQKASKALNEIIS